MTNISIYELEQAFEKAFSVTKVKLPFTSLRTVFIPSNEMYGAAEEGRLEAFFQGIKSQLPKDAVAVRADIQSCPAVNRGTADGWRAIFASREWPQHESSVIPEIGLKFEGVVYEKA